MQIRFCPDCRTMRLEGETICRGCGLDYRAFEPVEPPAPALPPSIERPVASPIPSAVPAAPTATPAAAPTPTGAPQAEPQAADDSVPGSATAPNSRPPRRGRSPRRLGLVAAGIAAIVVVALAGTLLVVGPGSAASSSGSPSPSQVASASQVAPSATTGRSVVAATPTPRPSLSATPNPTPTATPSPSASDVARGAVWQVLDGLNTATGGQGSVRVGNYVYVFGGTKDGGSGGAIKTVWSFNAVSHAWRRLADMSAARVYPMVVALDNNRILVAGGAANKVPLASAEVYDVKANTWHSAGTMTRGRVFGTATLLPSGSVLVAGGGVDACPDQKKACPATETAEVYRKGSWQLTGSMPEPRAHAAAVLLSTGDVLVTGGLSAWDGQHGTAYASTAVFHLNKWSPGPQMQSPRFDHAALRLSNDRVYVAGGFDTASTSNVPALKTVEHLSDGAWKSVASMAEGRARFALVALKDGRFLAVTGCDTSHGDGPDTAEFYDAGHNVWSGAGSLYPASYFAVVAVLPNGDVLVAGGTTADRPTDRVAILTPPAK